MSQTHNAILEHFALCTMRYAIVHANTITIVGGFKAKLMQKTHNDILHFFELPSHFSGR
jgi:hypothetical protein